MSGIEILVIIIGLIVGYFTISKMMTIKQKPPVNIGEKIIENNNVKSGNEK